MKKDNIILIFSFFILLSLFIIAGYDIVNVSQIMIGGRAVQETTNLTITVTESTTESPTSSSSGGGGGFSVFELIPKKPKPVEPLPEPIHKQGDLFDIEILIPDKYLELFSGEELVAEIKLINMKGLGLVDVNLDYYIKDTDQNIVHKESETRAVEKETSFLKKIQLPNNLVSGTYMLSADLKYKDDIATAGQPFRIIEQIEKSFIKRSYLIVFMILIISLITIIFLYFEHRRLEHIESSIKKIKRK